MPEIKTISRLERKNLSADGNPRFRIHFTDGTSAITQPDSSVVYSIENPEYRDVPLKVHTTPSGMVYNLEPTE